MSGEPEHKVQLYLGHATIQQTLGTYYHARIGNRGELGSVELMLELPAKTK
jgi:integrase